MHHWSINCIHLIVSRLLMSNSLSITSCVYLSLAEFVFVFVLTGKTNTYCRCDTRDTGSVKPLIGWQWPQRQCSPCDLIFRFGSCKSLPFHPLMTRDDDDLNDREKKEQSHTVTFSSFVLSCVSAQQDSTIFKVCLVFINLGWFFSQHGDGGGTSSGGLMLGAFRSD